MPSVEEQIERMVTDLLTRGVGVQNPLAEVLKQAFSSKLIACRLESTDGAFVASTHSSNEHQSELTKESVLPLFADKQHQGRTFLFSMTDTTWTVFTAFYAGVYPWFTTVTLDASTAASTPLKPGLFKLADYFTAQCKKQLHQFLASLSPGQFRATRFTDATTYEQTVLEHAVQFSSKVKSVVLLDEDGFVLASAGMDGAVTDLGAALARLFYRSTVELARLDATECTSITLSDHEYTIHMGKIRGTTLTCAISANGSNAQVIARFLLDALLDAFHQYIELNGNLCGVPAALTADPLRSKVSWFTPSTLVRKGMLVQKSGAASFHTPYCQMLATTDAATLSWYQNKNQALQAGLRPCSVCNP